MSESHLKITSTFTVTLTLDLDNPLLGSAHRLVTLIISTNLFQNLSICVEVTFRKRNFNCLL